MGSERQEDRSGDFDIPAIISVLGIEAEVDPSDEIVSVEFEGDIPGRKEILVIDKSHKAVILSGVSFSRVHFWQLTTTGVDFEINGVENTMVLKLQRKFDAYRDYVTWEFAYKEGFLETPRNSSV